MKSSGILKVGQSEEYQRRGNDIWARLKEEGGSMGREKEGWESKNTLRKTMQALHRKNTEI